MKDWEKFINDRVQKEAESGCWNWTKYCDKRGNAIFSSGKIRTQARKMVFEKLCGEVPDGFVLTNSCNNKKCVNPDHLDIIDKMDHHILKASRNICKRGHDLSDSYIMKSGKRQCKECCKLRYKGMI